MELLHQSQRKRSVCTRSTSSYLSKPDLQKQKVSTEKRTLAFTEFQNTTCNIVFMKKVPSLPLHLDYIKQTLGVPVL